MSKHWQAKVYKQHEESGMTLDEWIELKNETLERDKYRCLRCDKKFKRSELSAHHMKPRSEGGANSPSNLVTLCHKCHDIVEMDDLRSLAAIQGSLEIVKPASVVVKETKPTKWQQWVYGGFRKPR
jgi:hypothetical protein